MKRLAPALLAIACAACTRGGTAPAEPAPAAAQPTEATAALQEAKRDRPGEGDVPLPDPDRVPDFLLDGAQDGASARAARATGTDIPVPSEALPPAAAALPEAPRDAGDPADPLSRPRDPTLAELMRHVRVEGEGAADGEDSWIFIGLEPSQGEEMPETATAMPTAEPAHGPVRPAVAVEDSEVPPADERTARALLPETDPCAELRALVERRKEYLRRTAAERDQFGWVENEADSQALRLLAGLRRCAEHPDDEDCRQRPIEVDISALEMPAELIEFDPSELDAEGRHPDEIPHDPQVRDLLRRLERCERERMAQPLLERHSPPR